MRRLSAVLVLLLTMLFASTSSAASCRLRDAIYVSWQNAETAVTTAQVYRDTAAYGVLGAEWSVRQAQFDIIDHLQFYPNCNETCVVLGVMLETLDSAYQTLRQKEGALYAAEYVLQSAIATADTRYQALCVHWEACSLCSP